ncbi:DUF5753 domain-containing protein [Streptomyces canus]|uniref:DUF5753 domain-containing protein n=1 Tax=Streptomyces canus TaxID=58343 RepID=UPI0035901861
MRRPVRRLLPDAVDAVAVRAQPPGETLSEGQRGEVLLLTQQLPHLAVEGHRVQPYDPPRVEVVLRSQLPSWFQQVAELEARATEVCTFQATMIHGLLQTPAYARATLSALRRNDLDDRTAVRLARQRIFEKEEPPVFWMVISEAALYQEIGDKETMRGQLTHLLSFESDPQINIQVLPFSAGAHAGLTGSFNLYRFGSDPTIVYTEGYGSGHPTANPDTVKDCTLRYDHLRAAALSLRDSAELIRRAMEDRYGEQLA